MSWTAVSATTGVWGATSATTGAWGGAVATAGSWDAVSGSTGAWGTPSQASAWQRFVTLGVVRQGDDVDFKYVATEGGYAVASALFPIRASETTLEQP